MKAIDVVEYKGQDDDNNKKGHNGRFKTSKIRLSEKGTPSSDNSNFKLLSVFNYDGFDNVGSIFTFVGNDLHNLVDLPFLNDFFCIRLGFE